MRGKLKSGKNQNCGKKLKDGKTNWSSGKIENSGKNENRDKNENWEKKLEIGKK